MAKEGNLEAPTRHALGWESPDFYNEEKCFDELERIFDICHGCRRCVSLCGSFPTLFDLIDATEDGEVEQGRGIGVQDCVLVTQQVGAMLDVHDPISGEYALEVSSPGWDRPFFQLNQLPAYVGQQVALRLIAAVENRRKFQAKLLSVDLENEMIQVEVEGQHVLEIDSNNIDKANLIYQD